MVQFFLITLITIGCSLPLVCMENNDQATNGEQIATKVTTPKIQLSPKALAYEELNKKMKSYAEGNATQVELREANLKYEEERQKEDEARRERVRRNLFSERE